MEQDIIIVGAGASGLVAAIAAAEKGSRVLVIEHKDKAGKKILATGNGKCNFTNLNQAPECYRSDDSTFAMKVLSHFDYRKTIQFFEELGIIPRERNGYLYPNSEQATSIVQVLVMECERLGVRFQYNERVTEIKPINQTNQMNRQANSLGMNKNKKINMAQQSLHSMQEWNKDGYQVKTETIGEPKKGNTYFAPNCILATGGCASPKLGSDGSGFTLAKSLGHTLIKPLPALVQLKASDKFCKTLSGVRTTGKVTIFEEDLKQGNIINKLSEEEGELVFTDYGISGIPILQISRFAAKALDKKIKLKLRIDFFPQYSREKIYSILSDRIRQGKHKNLEEMMVGFLNHKLNFIIIKEAKLDPYLNCDQLNNKDLQRLSLMIKEFTMTITDTNSFENAQVSTGGVKTSEIDDRSMESKLHRGLYFSGELVDVDGTCGGYNLQWAWSSGYLAGTSAARTNATPFNVDL